MRADVMPGIDWCRLRLALVIGTWACAGVCILATSIAAPAAPKQVMLLHTLGFQGYEEYARSIREELDRQYRQPLEIDEALIGQTIAANQSEAASFVDYLRVHLANRQPDLIVSVGAGAVDFLQQHRKQLLPHNTRIVFTAITQNLVPAGLTENDAVVAFSFDFVGLFEKFLRAVPETKNVVALNGTSPVGCPPWRWRDLSGIRSCMHGVMAGGPLLRRPSDYTVGGGQYHHRSLDTFVALNRLLA
jgi:hypothetical protein